MGVSNRRGSALPLVMITSALVFVISYVIFSMLQSRRTGTEDDLKTLQAKMLAADIVELGKYLLLYERIVYIDDPLAISSDRTATRKEILAQSYGSLASVNSFMLNACGGYDANAVEVGPLVADGSPVFCPFYLRNPLLDGKMFEEMMLKMWSTSGPVGELALSGGVLSTKNSSRKAIMGRDSAGGYKLIIDFENAVRNNDNQFIRLHLNQNIVKQMRQNGFSAKLTYTLFGPSTGFKTLSNERYVNIQADVTYGSAFNRIAVNTAYTSVLYSSTVKDFALFMIYPEDNAGLATTLFSKAVDLSASSQINGRVFFNGDIDTALTELPVFNEVVIISGKLNTAGYTFAEAQKLMSQKFRKGIVMGYPVKRLINDGECVSGMPTANESGMYCKDPVSTGVNYNVSRYVQNLGNICSTLKVEFNSGAYVYNTTGVVDAMKIEQCKGSAPGKVFLSGGADRVTVGGSHAYIVTPVRNLKLGIGNMYGVVLGGHISGNGSKIYSLGALRTGLPGIASTNDLTAITSEARTIMAGVGVPLISVPLIKEANVGK